MRSGDEPGHARSPLEFRLGLAAFGLAMALVSAVVVRPVAPTAVVVLFLLIALVAAVDLVAVRRQMKRGAHFQPGPEVPPYRPVETAPPVRPQRAPATERTRMRRYLALMAACLTLIILAWFWVRFYSTTIAVAMSMVAAVLPSIAVIVANFGVRLPDEPPAPPRYRRYRRYRRYLRIGLIGRFRRPQGRAGHRTPIIPIRRVTPAVERAPIRADRRARLRWAVVERKG